MTVLNRWFQALGCGKERCLMAVIVWGNWRDCLEKPPNSRLMNVLSFVRILQHN